MIDNQQTQHQAGVPVVAVVGTRAEARLEYATELARTLGRDLVTSFRLRAADQPVYEAGRLAARAESPAGAVVEVPDRVSTRDLAAELSGGRPETRLEAVVCVIDAEHGIEDLFREDYLVPRTGHPSTATARSLVSITHVEHCSSIVLLHWEDVPTDELRTLLALLHHLNPKARLRLVEEMRDLDDYSADGDYDPSVDRPGWSGLLGGEFEAYIQDPRVAALRYDCSRPFHPVRLHELVHELMSPGRFGTVVRSAGYCRVASSTNVTGHWNHVGRVMALSPVSLDDDLDLNRDALVSALDAAVLTDEEFLADPATWKDQLRRLR